MFSARFYVTACSVVFVVYSHRCVHSLVLQIYVNAEFNQISRSLNTSVVTDIVLVSCSRLSCITVVYELCYFIIIIIVVDDENVTLNAVVVQMFSHTA